MRMCEHNGNSQQVSGFLHNLNAARLNKISCDFEIVSKALAYPCHRIVLQCRLDRSTSIYTDLFGMANRYECRKEYSSVAVESFLHYLYTFETNCPEIGKSLFQCFEIIEISQEFNLTEFGEFGHECLKSCFQFLTADQWFPLYRYVVENADATAGVDEVKEKCLLYGCEQFLQIVQMKEFNELTGVQLEKLIRADELHVNDEQEVLDAVRTWIRHDEDTRMHLAGELLRCVRLPMMRLTFRDYKRMGNENIFAFGEGKQLLDNAMEYRDCPAMRWILQSPQSRPRLSLGSKETILGLYAFEYVTTYTLCDGGWQVSSGTVLDENEIKESFRWQGRYAGTSCRFGDRFFLIDSENGLFFSTNDISTNLWKRSTCSFGHRVGVECVATNDGIYLIGGSNTANTRSPVSTVERYVLERDRWERVADLPVAVLYPCVFFTGNKIYAIGGFGVNNCKSETVSHIQVYDCEHHTWSLIENAFPEAGDSMSAVCYDSIVYVLATSGNLYSFDLGTFEFTVIVSLNDDCFGASMTLLKGSIFIFRRKKGALVIDIETRTMRNTIMPPGDNRLLFFTIHQDL